MTPLMDVIFLLLTFFIYTLVMTVRAQVMPVVLPALSTGQAPEKEVEIAALTVDRQGRFFLNQKPVTQADLEARLKELAAQPKPPQFFLAIDAQPGETDRGPLLIELIETFRRLNIQSFNIVGTPKGDKESSPVPANPTDSGSIISK